VVSGGLPVAMMCEVGTTRLNEMMTTALLTSIIGSKIFLLEVRQIYRVNIPKMAPNRDIEI
jgi:L-asparaginase II